MIIEQTNLSGVLLIKPKIFGDERGYFLETFRANKYREAGIDIEFVQDNQSFSLKNVLRGLHYQLNNPQGKLIQVIQGEIFDVAVDIRHGSSSFGECFSTILSSENHHQLYIPPGFAHGFCVLSDEARFSYKCTNYYDPSSEFGIVWNDPELEIPWPITSPQLSPKDADYKMLRNVDADVLPEYISDKVVL